MSRRVSRRGSRFSGRQWLILAGLAIVNVVVLGFVALAWWLTAALVPPAAAPPGGLPPEPAADLPYPPTWTPTATRTPAPPTATPTLVLIGPAPASTATPEPAPDLFRTPTPVPALADLARIMQGESPGDMRAAYYVGWVAKNRLLAGGYGRTYAEVARGFNGYRTSAVAREPFLRLAKQVIVARRDPTGGSIYALSHTDLNNLGLSPETAASGVGQWYFFREWPRRRRF